jgi:putative ABC transport system substrate-binding protein
MARVHGGSRRRSRSLAARGTRSGAAVRIGFLSLTPPAASPGLVNAFRDALRDHGYIEGQNLVLEYRWPTGSFERSSEMVAELARNVDVILAWTSPAVIAARRATSTVPIVMVGAADPVGMGFIANLARPGGNVTGTSIVSNDLSGKLVQMLVEIVPGIRRIGVVANPDNPGVALQQRATEEAARAIGRNVQVVSAHTLEEFQSVFARLGADGSQGVLLLADPPQRAALFVVYVG